MRAAASPPAMPCRDPAGSAADARAGQFRSGATVQSRRWPGRRPAHPAPLRSGERSYVATWPAHVLRRRSASERCGDDVGTAAGRRPARRRVRRAVGRPLPAPRPRPVDRSQLRTTARSVPPWLGGERRRSTELTAVTRGGPRLIRPSFASAASPNHESALACPRVPACPGQTIVRRSPSTSAHRRPSELVLLTGKPPSCRNRGRRRSASRE